MLLFQLQHDQGDDGSTKQPSITLLDPEQLYSKVIRNKQSPQQQQQVQSDVTAAPPDEEDYSCLQHQKTNNDVPNLLPSCSPQLYSILDNPHKPVLAIYDSMESTDQQQQQHNSDELLSASEVTTQAQTIPANLLPPTKVIVREKTSTN